VKDNATVKQHNDVVDIPIQEGLLQALELAHKYPEHSLDVFSNVLMVMQVSMLLVGDR